MANNIAKRSGRLEKEDGTYINTADYLYNSTDAFGISIADGTKNLADLASHYTHSPERRRLYINGTRFLLQYGTTSKFEDKSDSYTLKPAAGDTMEYRTAERYRYAVGYVMAPSWAFAINQQLQGDDKVVIGYGDVDIANDMTDANGWFWEFTSDLTVNQVKLTTYRDGTPLDSKTVSIEKAYTFWQRCEDRINWYNVGIREARQTYTVDGEQFNEIIGATSVDDSKGPSRGNFPFTFAIKADAGTSDLELDTGSVGVKLLGEIDGVLRTKEAVLTGSHSGGGDFEPLFAIRENPDLNNVYINLTNIEIGEVSVDDDVEILAISVDPSKTDASTWATSIYHSGKNSALQVTTSVTEFPDPNGIVVTSASDTGGYQVGFSSYYTAGQGTSNRRTSSASGIRKRPINGGDIIIFLARTSSAMNITIDFETEQQW